MNRSVANPFLFNGLTNIPVEADALNTGKSVGTLLSLDGSWLVRHETCSIDRAKKKELHFGIQKSPWLSLQTLVAVHGRIGGC